MGLEYFPAAAASCLPDTSALPTMPRLTACADLQADLGKETLSDLLLNRVWPHNHHADTSASLCCSICFLTFPGKAFSASRSS